MSEYGVYEDEMLKKFSDQDVDRLLSGKAPESEELARLAPILRALHAQHKTTSEDRVASFAAKAAELARSTRHGQAESGAHERTLTRARRFALGLRQKLATGLAAALLLSGLTGVAVASNGAAPGDLLYNLDRALEGIGIGDGKAAERIDEARTLFASGRVAEAIAHAAEAVEVPEGDVEVLSPEASNASTALRDAAANVAGGDGADTENESEEVRFAVAAMLGSMADMLESEDFDGHTFGEAVATMARGIGGTPDELPDAAENGAAGVDSSEDGLETADEATDNTSTDTADETTDNTGTDTAGDATEGIPSGRP